MTKQGGLSDYVGIFSAFLCLVHCLAGPIIVGVASTAHGHAHAHDADMPFLLHPAWDYVFLIIGFVAVYYSARHSHQLIMRVLLWLSFAFLAAAILLEGMGPIFQYLVYAAGGLLILMHSANLRSMIRGLRARNGQALPCSNGTRKIPGKQRNVEMISRTDMAKGVESHQLEVPFQ